MLEAVVQLERELTAVWRQVGALAAEPVAAVARLRIAVEAATLTMSTLRYRVLDDATGLTIALQEAGVRARAAIVRLLLANLAEAEHELAADAPPLVPPFERVADFAAYVLDRLGRASAGWVRERSALALVADHAGQNTCEALYRVALNNAEYAFVAIGKDPVVARFLIAGSQVSSSRCRLGCRTLALVFESAGALVTQESTQPTRARADTPPARRVAVGAGPNPSTETSR